MVEKKEIPLYTKIGFRVTVVILLVLTIFLVQRCVDSVRYGTGTAEMEVLEQYQRGYAAGIRQGGMGLPEESVEFENPLLKKAYLRGFREGWDSARRVEKSEKSSAQRSTF